MGLFTPSRTTRAQRRAQAKALKAKAELEARLESRGQRKERKARRRHEKKIVDKQIKAQRKSDETAAKIAADTNKATEKLAQSRIELAQNGTAITPRKLRRYLSIAKVASPIVVPLAYRGATLAREQLTVWEANRAGVPVEELARYSGHGAALSARIAGAEKSVTTLAGTRDADAETTKFVSAMKGRLRDLTAAVSAAEHMPGSRRRSAHQAIARELGGIESDLLARLGVRP
ncbi:DUF6474 family protein [Williamsia deligens]|uniref:DUF6474 family protein n=1 Tax=Williamsia deligens TaxID=321325 RepID=A0ABW3G4E8_9NOCA|nr:DUF6474 family protein [Williamsia deligens]MCP2193904.1 hypothetical protein [Williamsia deligens]